MTANVTSLVTITTFLVRMLFRAIICKDGAADLRQYEACFQGFFFFYLFSVVYLCFMAQLPYDQWRGSLSSAKLTGVQARICGERMELS